MRGSEHPDPVRGPLENLSQAYFAGFDRVAKTYEPAVNGLGRYNVEVAGLAVRRARAWFEIPSTLSRCKTPQDLLSEQAKFWQTAMAQYTQSWQRFGAALGSFAVASALNVHSTANTGAPARDFITFPEPSSEPIEKTDRRAA